ncbi:reverse transcriptase domain-containing protein [Tanacetum coccineum]
MMADTRTMAELLQAPTEGYGDAIVIPAILAENFKLKHGLLNLVTSKKSCGFEKEDPHVHIRWFNKITLTIKYKDVPNSSIKLMLFPFSIEGAVRIWLKKEPPRSIAWERFKDLLRACLYHGFTELHQIDNFYNSLTSADQDSLNAAAGGNLLTKTPKDALTLIENKSKVCTSRNRPVLTKVSTNTSTSGLLPNVVALTDAVKALLLKNRTPLPASVKAVEESCVTGGGPHPYYQCLATDGKTFSQDIKIITNAMFYSAAVNIIQGMLEPAVTKDPVQPSTEKVKPPDVSHQAPTSEPVISPKPKPYLPYPSRLNNHKLREKDDHQMMKFLQIFRSLHFDLSFTDALLYMPKLASTFKNLLSNKEKLFELANTPIVEWLALTDLGASINLMPLSIWRKLSLPEFTPTQIILELADWSTTRPTGIAEDVFVRVGKFHFPADFIVVDYVVDPRVPLILGRPFLRTARALIDVYGEELTLRVSDEAITFKVGNTSRYSYNDVELINRIDVIDIACEEYSQEVLGFFDNSESGNPTLIFEPIIAKTSPSLTPFEGGDFILEEIETYLASDPIPSGMDDAEFDPAGDIHLIEEMLNNDTYSPLPSKDLKCEELKSVKSLVDEP